MLTDIFGKLDIPAVGFTSGDGSTRIFVENWDLAFPADYWTAEIDTDGDGQICDGDLIQDEALSPLEPYSLVDLMAETLFELSLKVKIGEGGICHNI